MLEISILSAIALAAIAVIGATLRRAFVAGPEEEGKWYRDMTRKAGRG